MHRPPSLRPADPRDAKELIALIALEHANEFPASVRISLYMEASEILKGTIQGESAGLAAFHLGAVERLQTEFKEILRQTDPPTA